MTEKIPSLEDILSQIPLIEQQSARDAMRIYTPAEEIDAFYLNLCRVYLAASPTQRAVIRKAIVDKEGILNNLLGFIYQCAERLQETQNRDWLLIGLAAASMRGDGPDFRDFYLALTELYIASLDAGIDPKDEFNAIQGGVPINFDTFAVLKGRLSGDKNT
ncbi:MAG: hypothetical protein JW908_03570 [Anaerolineales bacterium]|nr:hypothetical protein [Anaerolineales bacterium]